VSLENVVATMEIPASHQGTERPDAKNSAVFLPERLPKNSAGTKQTATETKAMIQSRVWSCMANLRVYFLAARRARSGSNSWRPMCGQPAWARAAASSRIPASHTPSVSSEKQYQVHSDLKGDHMKLNIPLILACLTPLSAADPTGAVLWNTTQFNALEKTLATKMDETKSGTGPLLNAIAIRPFSSIARQPDWPRFT